MNQKLAPKVVELVPVLNFSAVPVFMSMISDYVSRDSTTSSNALV